MGLNATSLSTNFASCSGMVVIDWHFATL